MAYNSRRIVAPCPLTELTIPRKNRGWELLIDGNVVDVRHIMTLSSSFGRLTYGQASGYDTWSFGEPGGGGSVILPFLEWNGCLHVGLVEQLRHNLGGMALNAPRGFLDPGEVHFDAARRELAEEMGLNITTGIVELPGDPANPNSAFFETPGQELGVRFYGLEVSPALIIERDGHIIFADHVIATDPQSASHRTREQIGKARFIDWRKAATVKCMLTVAGVARLLAHLNYDE